MSPVENCQLFIKVIEIRQYLFSFAKMLIVRIFALQWLVYVTILVMFFVFVHRNFGKKEKDLPENTWFLKLMECLIIRKLSPLLKYWSIIHRDIVQIIFFNTRICKFYGFRILIKRHSQLYSNQPQLICENDCFDVAENVTILSKYRKFNACFSYLPYVILGLTYFRWNQLSFNPCKKEMWDSNISNLLIKTRQSNV